MKSSFKPQSGICNIGTSTVVAAKRAEEDILGQSTHQKIHHQMTPGHTEATSTSKRTKESTLTTHRVAASVTSEDSEGDNDRNESQQKKGKPGRKPANDQPLNHQQARQRANQRAFRERGPMNSKHSKMK
ncbi:hypothetical protein BCR33DRAFT_337266 [Rhizoclosmatium globosum]|uniref:Uncharacterized protein n=1 Tax=Rhizoclosmatium globosum TaxID=329046 RepID=A0A1Y2C3M7_9FUNG|nr:hypothetical protein BCR33DRAFT_337266 [Rhizoclosmatium globosum]|eukprot:ORY41653.1 hypothetical protein BCR33DRAFT_337266 [Rhizoclosmatium globosum]